jgi:hypothetical protein|nr:MAG TPA: NinG recombination protein [Caudoviricetes sp.]
MIDYKEQMNDPRWVERSREIMKRDDFTCQLCGKSHTKLNVHHIRYIKGKDYWDYPDELLMTVCENCHQKIHGKYKANLTNKSVNKFVVYYDVLRDKRLTPNSKIVLCDLMYIHLIGQKSSYRERAKVIGISLKSYELSIYLLRSYGYLDKSNTILFKVENLKYFPLLLESGLKGELLIFYSYLKHKSEYFGGTIDTFKYKLAEEFHTTKIAVTNMLNRLYRKGFAERLENGKLKIN